MCMLSCFVCFSWVAQAQISIMFAQGIPTRPPNSTRAKWRATGTWKCRNGWTWWVGKQLTWNLKQWDIIGDPQITRISHPENGAPTRSTHLEFGKSCVDVHNHRFDVCAEHGRLVVWQSTVQHVSQHYVLLVEKNSYAGNVVHVSHPKKASFPGTRIHDIHWYIYTNIYIYIHIYDLCFPNTSYGFQSNPSYLRRLPAFSLPSCLLSRCLWNAPAQHHQLNNLCKKSLWLGDGPMVMPQSILDLNSLCVNRM